MDQSKMIHLGLDLGTKTIVLARRDDSDKISFRHEINGFFSFDRPDSFTKKMLSTQKVPYIEKDNRLYALGGKAEKMAYAFNKTLQRPMAEGTISQEQEAITIMASIVQAIIGKLDANAILYYCIPANALNKSTNVDFHDRIARMIIEGYKKTDAQIKAFSINEARAIAIASEEPVAMACSFGAGMVNVCYTMFGVPVFEFSIVGSGDWIDVQTAKQFGYDPDKPNNNSAETPTSIAHRKHEIDLTKNVSEVDRVDQAIMLHYQLLIENVVRGIVGGFKSNIDKARIEQAIPLIIAGGTSSPSGFAEYFEKILFSEQLPFEVSSVQVKERPLFTVAEGCMRAAEAHED